MNHDRNMNEISRLGGVAAITGALCMFIGAAFYFSTGADLWTALTNGNMASYLTAVGGVKTQLVINLTFWILGVLFLGSAGWQMSELCQRRRSLAGVAKVGFLTAVPLAVVAFIAMLALVVQIAPDTSETAVAMANVMGWFGARADDLATALIVGAGPFFVSWAGREEWVPGWLFLWGVVAAVIGGGSIVGIYLPAFSNLGFLIIPIGLGWMLASGVILLRYSRASTKNSVNKTNKLQVEGG